jgi:hypothetical protein
MVESIAEPCDVYPAPFNVKLSGDAADEAPTVVQPDLTVVCDEAKLTEQGVSGAPELVEELIEVYTLEDSRFRRLGVFGPKDSLTSTKVPAVTVDLSLRFRQEK